MQVRLTTRTLSNSMDVGNPSNFERIRNLYGSDIMQMRADFSAYSFSDEETREAIEEIFEKYAYISEPHSAVGYLGWKAAKKSVKNAVLLQTAHPAKFADALPPGMSIPIPPELTAMVNRPKQSVPLKADFHAFKSFLLASS